MLERERRGSHGRPARGSSVHERHEPPGAAGGILRMQRLAGNGAVASALTARQATAAPPGAAVTVQRDPPTREENLAALWRELTDASADPAKWADVARRLNGFAKGDLANVCKEIPKTQLQAARTAVERTLAGWPGQADILAALDARARSQKVAMRPTGSSIWAAYSQVGYNVWAGEENKNEVWKFLGGSVGKKYLGGNTCSARVSWALNNGGYPITGRGEVNDPEKSFNGKKGDGKNYIVWVPSLQSYLTSVWGKPDKILTSNAEAVAFEASLGPDEVAVFAGPEHSGVIKHGYSDAYVKTDPDVLPVAVWKLP